MMTSNCEEKLRFPYEFYELDPKLEEQLMGDFRGVRSGFIQVGPERWLYPKSYKEEASTYYNLEIHPSDVWLTGLARSGTTLTQEMVWLISNNSNFEAASKTQLEKRFPFLELDAVKQVDVIEEIKKGLLSAAEKLLFSERCNNSVSKKVEENHIRRFIKTHLPFSLIPPDILRKGCKVIYVARNPLDVAVSLYHFYRSGRHVDYSGNFSTFWGYFKNNLVTQTSYWAHIKEGWERRHEKNLLFLFYEDIVTDRKTAIRSVANFLGVTLKEKEVRQLDDHLQFERFKTNKSVNHDSDIELNLFREGEGGFIRKGKIGDWRDYFDEEQAKEAEEWVKENQKAIGIEFKF